MENWKKDGKVVGFFWKDVENETTREGFLF